MVIVRALSGCAQPLAFADSGSCATRRRIAEKISLQCSSAWRAIQFAVGGCLGSAVHPSRRRGCPRRKRRCLGSPQRKRQSTLACRVCDIDREQDHCLVWPQKASARLPLDRMERAVCPSIAFRDCLLAQAKQHYWHNCFSSINNEEPEACHLGLLPKQSRYCVSRGGELYRCARFRCAENHRATRRKFVKQLIRAALAQP
jgi:hypothetical protein